MDRFKPSTRRFLNTRIRYSFCSFVLCLLKQTPVQQRIVNSRGEIVLQNDVERVARRQNVLQQATILQVVTVH